MYRNLLVALAALWAIALSPVRAQDKKLTVRAEFAPASAAPGQEVTLRVSLKIDEGWHVYGRDEEIGEPPRLELPADAPLAAVGPTVLPVGKLHETAGIESHWVTGVAVLEQRMRVPDGAAGALSLRGVVHYMVCDESTCLPPDSDPFAATLTVVRGAPAQAPIPEPGPDRKVTFGARFEPATVPAGGTAELVVDLRILDGWHVYGSRETTGIPVTVRVAEGAPVTAVGGAKIPAGTLHDTFGIESYWVTETAELRLRVQVPAGTAVGALPVPFVVDYSACDDESCDPPGELVGSATLGVTAAAAAVADPSGGRDPFGDSDPFGLAGTKPVPRFVTHLEPEVARPGEVVDVVVSVTVPEGWHAYGAKDENPVRLVATAAEGFEPRGGNRLPDGTRHETGSLVNFWIGGGFELRQAFAVPADLEPGDRELGFRIDYMLCDENSCQPPAQHGFELALGIEAGPVREEFSGAVLGLADPATAKTGWWKLILGAVLAGLFALLMPCTYPMIPITISVFTKQAEARGGKVLPVSLVYGAGIVSIFVLIGIVVGPAIVPFATHWLTNAVIAAFFVIFAFSLFGWITLEPPRFLMNVAGKAQTQSGYVGVLLMGAALVITSFTCTVPFVGVLLAAAAQGGLGQLVVGMGVFGLTMALPFVALSLVPGRLRGIPRAGNWMNTLKVFLGFVELAAAMKFISNVDLVLNDGPVWLSRSTFLWSWAVIMGLAGVYLARGLFVPSEKAGLKRAAGAAASLAFAAWCAFGATGRDLDAVMTAIAPPKSTAEAGARHEIVKDDYEQALATALRQDKLVLINFTGFT
jgi:thiol:disulfide interchange protein DsbD